MGNILGVCRSENGDVDQTTIPKGKKGEEIIRKKMRSIPGVISLNLAQLRSLPYGKKGVFNAIAALELVLESRNSDEKFFNRAMQNAVEKVSLVDMKMGERLEKSFERLTKIKLKKILKEADETSKDGMASIKKAEKLGSRFDDRLKYIIDKSRDDRIDPVEIEAVMERNLAPQHGNVTSKESDELVMKYTLEVLKRKFLNYYQLCKEPMVSFIFKRKDLSIDEQTASLLIDWWNQIEVLHKEFNSKDKEFNSKDADVVTFIDSKKIDQITAAVLYERCKRSG